MKSVKPGRGPSFMGGIGSVAAIIFGVIWTVAVVSMDAPAFFPLFGVIFIILGICQAAYNFKNAIGKQRFSAFDIVDEGEEADPLNEQFGQQKQAEFTKEVGENANFCPYCGSQVKSAYEFCRQCGKKL